MGLPIGAPAIDLAEIALDAFTDLTRDAYARLFDQHDRPLRLRFAGRHGEAFDGVLVLQQVDVTEAVCEGITAHLTCLTTRADLPLAHLVGQPVEVQVVTDRGGLRRLCVIVTQVRRGQSDGGLTVLQLTGRDIFGVMQGRRSNRVFLDKSVPQIVRTVLDGWRRRFPAVGRAFDYRWLGIDERAYPPRAMTLQAHQSDTAFLKGLLAASGIAWFFQAGEAGSAQELVLFDDGRQLPENPAGPIRYHRRSGVEPRDTVSLLAPVHTLTGGSVTRSSHDHEAARVDIAREQTAVVQGPSADELAAALDDARIELPHAGDSWDDHQRLTRLSMQREEYRARCLHGLGGVRDMAPGSYHRIDGHFLLDGLDPAAREHITVRNRFSAHNSLPKTLKDAVQALLASSEAGVDGWIVAPRDARDADRADDDEHRFTNRFVAVPRDVPIVPAWPSDHGPPAMPLMTAIVVGPEGEPVWCDELGRVKVSILGLDPADHAHASGAGTTGTEVDSAWVRVNFLWAGDGFGIVHPLRAGMEVTLGFDHGDPSRPTITGTRYNAANRPPRFDHLGSLPANRALSGVVTRELRGHRQQQLRFNDSAGDISAQLGTDHGATQLNLGSLATPMSEGSTRPRGEGFELRTDESGAIRSAKSLLISAWKRLDSSDGQLSAQEHVALMQDCLDLFKSLGDSAAQHHAPAFESAPQQALCGDVKAAALGSNVEPKGVGGAPTLSLTAPAGIAVTTPKTIVSYAGGDLDAVARQHIQHAAGQRFGVNAGQGIGLFAHHGGVTAIAHHGTLTLESQHDDTLLDSAKNLQARAVEHVVLSGKTLSFVAHDGSFIKIGDGGITLGSPGPIAQKAASFRHSGPATLSSDLPSFGRGGTDQRFVLRYGGHRGQPAANRRYEIGFRDGSVVKGVSDREGRTELLARDALHIVDIRIFGDD